MTLKRQNDSERCSLALGGQEHKSESADLVASVLKIVSVVVPSASSPPASPQRLISWAERSGVGT